MRPSCQKKRFGQSTGCRMWLLCSLALNLLHLCLAFQVSTLARSNYVSRAKPFQPNIGPVLVGSHQAQSSSACKVSILAGAETSSTATYDWSFLDAVYLITCPNADPGLERLNRAKQILSKVNLLDKVVVMEFDTDDDDRIRGCYTSHISVIREALATLDKSKPSKPFGNWLQAFMPLESEKEEGPGNRNPMVLVLEDNLALSGTLEQATLDEIANYAARGNNDWDVIHLSYIPYVPNLVVTRTDNDRMVKLSCGIGSALGTTAYIINKDAMKRVLEQDDKRGFYAPIPDVMAELFPDSRYASYPTPFVRAPKTKSLVNPQLDELREVLFQPAVAAQVQRVLALSGLSTNSLLPITIVLLLISTAISGKATIEAGWSLLSTGSYDGPILLTVLSTAFTMFSLGILVQGAMLAPKPPKTEP